MKPNPKLDAVFKLAVEICGGDAEKAEKFMLSPSPLFYGISPIVLCQLGESKRVILRLMQKISHPD